MPRQNSLGGQSEWRASAGKRRIGDAFIAVLWRRQGFSLLELMIAMALFTIVLGAAAQALITYHAAMTFHNERIIAMQNCKGVLDEMRAVRDEASGGGPWAITDRWPHGVADEALGTLRSETITVTYEDPEANPLEVRVTSQWRDPRGRVVSVNLSTVIANE